MTCGGIILGIFILFGGVWLGNELNSDWPLYVAIGIIVVFIILRVIEFIAISSRNKQEDKYFDIAFAHSDARERGETEDRIVVLSTGVEVTLTKFMMPTGKMMWYVNPHGADLTPAEQAEATAMLKEIFPKE